MPATQHTTNRRFRRELGAFRRARTIRVAAAVTFVAVAASSTGVIAEHPASVQRLGRWLGVGWGDGYHVCRDGGFRPGADLPPASFPDQFGPKPPAQQCGPIYPPGAGLPPSVARSTPTSTSHQTDCDSPISFGQSSIDPIPYAAETVIPPVGPAKSSPPLNASAAPQSPEPTPAEDAGTQQVPPSWLDFDSATSIVLPPDSFTPQNSALAPGDIGSDHSESASPSDLRLPSPARLPATDGPLLLEEQVPSEKIPPDQPATEFDLLIDESVQTGLPSVKRLPSGEGHRGDSEVDRATENVAVQSPSTVSPVIASPSTESSATKTSLTGPMPVQINRKFSSVAFETAPIRSNPFLGHQQPVDVPVSQSSELRVATTRGTQPDATWQPIRQPD